MEKEKITVFFVICDVRFEMQICDNKIVMTSVVAHNCVNHIIVFNTHLI